MECPICEEGELEYQPATPDVWYLSNGDPGYPGDPAEVDCSNENCPMYEDTFTNKEYQDLVEYYEQNADLDYYYDD